MSWVASWRSPGSEVVNRCSLWSVPPGSRPSQARGDSPRAGEPTPSARFATGLRSPGLPAPRDAAGHRGQDRPRLVPEVPLNRRLGAQGEPENGQESLRRLVSEAVPGQLISRQVAAIEGARTGSPQQGDRPLAKSKPDVSGDESLSRGD